MSRPHRGRHQRNLWVIAQYGFGIADLKTGYDRNGLYRSQRRIESTMLTEAGPDSGGRIGGETRVVKERAKREFAIDGQLIL